MVGDTAQLGNARVDIPIAIRTDGNAQRAAAAHLEQHSQIKGAHQNNHKRNRRAYEEVRPIRGATSLIRESLLF